MERKTDTAETVPLSVARLHNAGGHADVLLVCEHASNYIPDHLDNLGLEQDALNSHVAWDPGALAVARNMSRIMDAPLVASTVSRLVYDCNRPPKAADAMPKHSEVFDIPGNANLNTEQIADRVETVYEPFRSLLADTIANATSPPVLVTLHSFTPVYLGKPRAVEIGLLHDRDKRLANAMLDLAPAHTDLNTQRNNPYGPKDGVTHTLKLHALPNGLLNVMIEVRNDLIATKTAQEEIAKMLAGLVTQAVAALETAPEAT